MTQYIAIRNSTQEIEYGMGMRDEEDFSGPPSPPPVAEEGTTLVAWQGIIPFNKGVSPSCKLIWNGEAPEWTETASLEEIKALKNAEINLARGAANQSYFEFAGKQIACDAVSMLDIQSTNAEIALTREMPSTWPGAWKALDNTYVLIPDVATWTVFIKAMVSRGMAHFQQAQTLKQLLATADTPDAVAEIKWATSQRGT